MSDSKPKIAVLAGGVSEERQVSIQSGQCIAQALTDAGFNVVVSDIGPNNLEILDDGNIDVFFIALHGKFGEDGQLQQILEDKSLCYTGSGPEASRLAFDKWATKKSLSKAGIKTPKAIEYNSQIDRQELHKKILQLGNKFIIKPHRQGSTIGVTIADEPMAALEAAKQCQSKFGDCMIEEFIEGREFTVSILGDRPLPVIEIRTKTGFYDYHAKYIDEQTEFLFDTVDSTLSGEIQKKALQCFYALGLRHFARIDLIVGNDSGIYILEANSVPGMTTHSLLPKAAKKAGLSMAQLCSEIVNMALLAYSV